MGYYTQKAKRAYELYLKKQPLKKVYAVVEKDNKYIVLVSTKGKYKYSLAGGGVDEGEDNITAIKREILEELNTKAEVVRSLGFIRYKSSWNYNDIAFDVDNEAEIFYTKFVAFGDNAKLGLDGEFDKNQTITEITKDEMLTNVAEFTTFGIKFD